MNGAQGWLGPTLRAATEVIGWLYGDWRKRVEERRRAKALDIEKALRAEIAAHLHQLRQFDLEEDRRHTCALIQTGGDGENRSVPMPPRQRHDTIFQAMVADIHLLSTHTVRPVTLHYNQIVMIAEMAETIRSAACADLKVARREAIYSDLVSMRVTAPAMGEQAQAALSRDIARLEAPAPCSAARTRTRHPALGTRRRQGLLRRRDRAFSNVHAPYVCKKQYIAQGRIASILSATGGDAKARRQGEAKR